jgi:hypothetical protein
MAWLQVAVWRCCCGAASWLLLLLLLLLLLPQLLLVLVSLLPVAWVLRVQVRALRRRLVEVALRAAVGARQREAAALLVLLVLLPLLPLPVD